MAIRRLKVSNFRSFNELDVELGDFNVLIGANASGKSNFIEIFRFLRDIRKEGLRNAVALQGGRNYVRNLQLGASRELSIEFSDDQNVAYGVVTHDEEDKAVFLRVKEMLYRFSLSASALNGRSHEDGWQIQDERVTRKFSAYRRPYEAVGNSDEVEELLGEGRFQAWWDRDKLVPKFDIDSHIGEPFLENVKFLSVDPEWFPPDTLLMESEFFPALLAGKPVPPFGTINELGIYRIEPRAFLQTGRVRASAELSEGAENLVPILDRLLTNDSHRTMLLHLVRFLLPFVNEIGIQSVTDDSQLLFVTESYTESIRLYAALMSEGTIAAIALVVTLYFEDNSLVILEDPERGMHPKLMARTVEMMKEVSKHKQIIVTTHHPEMVRYAGVENLLLVTRDQDGFSQISRPADKTMVKQFLANDIGLDQLYVDDLLEV